MDERCLAALIMRDASFAELEHTLDVFCPFEAVGMVRQEIRHAHFLAYCLDPNRPHGFGDACLRAFLTVAVEAQGRASVDEVGILDVHLMDLQSAIVRREWRDIDLLIEVPASKFVLTVELKIDAAEGNGQLAKYVSTLEKERPDWRRYFAFLTKSGEDASEEQAGIWATLGLDTVEKVLRDVAERSITGSFSGSLLTSYLDMLRRHHLNDDRLEQLAADLWKRHREALQFLADRQPNALSDVMSRLMDQKEAIAEELSKATELTIVVDSVSGTGHLRFAVQEWDSVAGLKGKSNWTASQRFILLELARGRDNVKAYLQLGRGDQDMRNAIYERLKQGKANINNPDRFTSEWKRLVSSTMLKIKDDDERNTDHMAEKIRTGLIKLANDILPNYNAALKSEREN